MNSIIELRNIKKSYTGKTNVLDGISLTVNKGEFVMLVGKSGCGKSTLLNILGLLDTPSEGEYSFCGKDTMKMKDKEKALFRRDNIGFIFQSFYLIEELDVVSNVAHPLGYKGVKKAERNRIAEEKLSMLGLGDRLHDKITKLSGGEQQRVAIARALSNSPKVILADEPTGNLDRNNRENVMEIFRNLNNQGYTIVMVTHDMDLLPYASKVVMLEDGRVKDEIVRD